MAKTRDILSSFDEECSVINLCKEYGSSYVGDIRFALVSRLSEEQIKATYAREIEQFTPFVVISPEMYEAFTETSDNNERERKRDALYHDPFALELAELILVDEFANPVRICESIYVIASLIDRMLSLPENQGTRMYKKYVLGFSTREIANQEGVSMDTVQKCLLEARKSIKCAFRELGVINHD